MNSSQSDDIRNRLLIARLPAMPQILLKLIELCQSDDAGMAELAKLLANDAGMSARVLRVANSAAYQRTGRKVGLVQALTTLGADMIKTLIISESVFQTFNGFPHSDGTDLRPFWKHSLMAAIVARDLAKAMKYPQVEEAYLAGLLHDVGRLALLAVAPDIYSQNFMVRDDENLCALENRLLHISHTEAGAWLIERWNMDSFLSDSVLYHHEDEARVKTAHPLIRLVHLAHRLSEHAADAPLGANLGAFCGLSDTELLTLYQGAQAQVPKAAEWLGIDLSGVDELLATMPVAVPPPKVNPVQKRLTEEIRNRALVSELSQMFGRQKDDGQLLDSMRQNARVLFDLEDSVVFMISAGKQALVGTAMSEQRQRLAEFSIPLSGGGNVAEAALKRNLIFLSRDRGVLSMPEEQLLRAFGAQCLLCLPICCGTRCLGLLVAGIEAWRVPDLQGQDKLLMAFANQAAAALDAAAKDRNEMAQRIAGIQEEHLKNSRKVVHEANNPLSIIKNYLGVLDDKLARQEPVSGELSILNDEIDRVGSIIKEFAGVAPPVPASGSLVDVNRVISDIVRLFRESRFLPPSVQISARLPKEPCEIVGTADTLKQIFVNLIKNAVEALPQGGHIEIVNLGQVRYDGADYFEISVRDSGPGLPQEVLAKLFSPVRSTKAGENRGLGLSIVHGLVKKLSGQIECRSSRMGTSFELRLPVRQAQVLA